MYHNIIMSTKKHTKTHSTYAFESNTNSVAASQMRNALNKLADSSKLDDAARAKFENELDSFSRFSGDIW